MPVCNKVTIFFSHVHDLELGQSYFGSIKRFTRSGNGLLNIILTTIVYIAKNQKIPMPGTVIRHYREMRNYSQKWVASQMKISQNAYSKIENNITQLTVHHVKQLSKILDVPVLDLLKDNFEIHKPMIVPKVVTKDDLLEHVDLLKERVKDKSASKHDQYLVALSLIMAAENAVNAAH